MISFIDNHIGNSRSSIRRVITDIFSSYKIRFIISLLTVVALVSFIHTNSVFAQAANNGGNSTMNTDTDPTKRAQSYTLYKVGESCVRNAMRNTIKTKAGDNGATTPKIYGAGGSDGTDQGEWFADDNAFGFVFPNGKQNCEEIFKTGLSLWGFTDGQTFLRSMGYTFQSNVPQWVSPSNDGGVRADRFKQAVNGRVGGVEKLTDNTAKHLLYLSAFKGSECQAKNIIAYDNGDRTQKDWADNNSKQGSVVYTTVTLAEGKSTKKYIFTYNSDYQQKGVVWRWQGDGVSYPGQSSREDYLCSELATMISSSAPQLASWNESHTGQEVDPQAPVLDSSTNDTNTKSSCVVEGVGWIICPVLTFTAGIVDAAYGFVSNLLAVQPLLTTGDNAGVYEGWKVMRNLANIAFVIVFLIIIFSQLTSVGVSNYGVKKMLPRLIIAAVLVNLSFWVCAIAVDLSNVIGASMINIFNSVGGSIPAKPNIIAADNGEGAAGWAGIVTAVLAGGVGIYYIGLSALIPALLAAVVAIITVFLVLTLRQALIILLVVVAPLAFVAYLLPNTEDWFTKWRKFLTTLLLMYPIIAAIFGASALASKIVMNSSNDTIIQIMGACIAIIPLAVTPLVLKTAGGVLNRFAGMVNNREKGPIDRLRKVGDKYRESRNNLRNARALSGDGQLGRGAFVRWRTRRGAVANGRQSELNHASTDYIASQIQEKEGFRNSVAGGTMGNRASDEAQQRALANSINAKAKLEIEEVNAANVVLKNARLTQDEMRTLVGGGSVTSASGLTFNGSTSNAVRAAAIQHSVASNDIAAINSLWDESRTWGNDEKSAQLREVFADSLQASSSRPAYISQGAMAGLRTNGHSDIRSTVEDAINNNTYSAEKIAVADKDELNVVAQVLTTPRENEQGELTVSEAAIDKIKQNATKALEDDRINVRITKNLQQVQNISEAKQPPQGFIK